MHGKFFITGGAAVVGTIGGVVGSMIDGDFGIWSIILSTVGGLVGIWIGYKLSKMGY
jgi:hypothetical protein